MTLDKDTGELTDLIISKTNIDSNYPLVRGALYDLLAKFKAKARAEGAKGKFSCQVAGCDIPPTLCNKHADLLRDEIKKARASAVKDACQNHKKNCKTGYTATEWCYFCEIEGKARADERNASNERADDAFRAVFDKVEEHRKAHKGSCNCPACNPTIAQLYAEFIGKLQASEKPKDRRARSDKMR